MTKPLLFVTDGLKGIKDVVLTIYPKADIPSCLVHVMRNIAWKARVSNRGMIRADFKIVHTQAKKTLAIERLNKFLTTWEKVYPKVVEAIKANRYLFTFFDYPESIWPSIYSANLIEVVNKQIKRKIKAKIQFPSEKSTE